MGLLYSLIKIFKNDKEQAETQPEKEYVQAVPAASSEISEEDRLVVALAASIMAGKDKSGSYYHISSIKRVK